MKSIIKAIPLVAVVVASVVLSACASKQSQPVTSTPASYGYSK